MRSFTEADAVDCSVIIWRQLAETGGDEGEKRSIATPLAEAFGLERFDSNCPLCEYRSQESETCTECVLGKAFGLGACCVAPWCKWKNTYDVTERRHYAKEILDALLDIQCKDSFYTSTPVTFKPEPVWEDITEDCKAVYHGCGNGSKWFSLYYEDHAIFLFGVHGVMPWDCTWEGLGAEFKIETVDYSYPEAGDFKVWMKRKEEE